MKKTGVLILALILCLALCACGKSEAVIQTETLITVVGAVTLDSEPAIAAAESAYHALSEKEQAQVENYAVLTEARSAFDTMLAEEMEKRAFYYGEWKDIVYGNIRDFKEDNYGTLWELTDQGVKIQNVAYVLEDHGEFVRLVTEDEESDSILVPTKYLTTTEVEITGENWETYIQLQEVSAFVEYNDSDVINFDIWVLATFTDAVIDQVDRTVHEKYKTKFELVGKNYYGTVTVDETTKEFTVLGELKTRRDATVECDFWQYEIAEYIHTHVGNIPIDRGWTPVGIIFSATASETVPGEWELACYIPEYTVSNMQGTLLLYDLPVHK